MPILKDAAQVLRVFEQGNTSQVVVFLGRRLGQFRVHAKGARRCPKKGFEGGLDLLTRGEIVVYPRASEGLWIIKEWDERARPAIGQSLDMLRAASYLCELSEALTRPAGGGAFSVEDAPPNGASETRLYDALAAAADALAAKQAPGAVVLCYTLAALVCEGVLPDFEHCGGCGRRFQAAEKRMELQETGAQCEECVRAELAAQPGGVRRSVWLSPEAQRALRHMAHTFKPVRLSAPAAGLLARALILLVHGALERDLRTLLPAARLVHELGAASRAV